MYNQVLKLTSPIPPSVNHYLSYRAIIRYGKPLATSYKTKEAIRYQKEFINYVRHEVFRQRWRPMRDKYQHYYVDAVFYFPRTDMDANNYWKCMFDAITETGMIWVDDNTACERVQKICYDSANPRIELTIYPVEYIGVFDNAPQMEKFESICVGCRRYKRNCKILQQAKEGRIQEEIKDGVCQCFTQIKASAKDMREDNNNGSNKENDNSKKTTAEEGSGSKEGRRGRAGSKAGRAGKGTDSHGSDG